MRLSRMNCAGTLVHGGAGALSLLCATQAPGGLRVNEEEREALDLVLHGEQGF